MLLEGARIVPTLPIRSIFAPRLSERNGRRRLRNDSRARACLVHVCEVPLDGWEALHARMGTEYPSFATHVMVLIEDVERKGYHCYDFLPVRTRCWKSAVVLLFGGSVPATRRKRFLIRFPHGNHWCIGPSVHVDPFQEADGFWNDQDESLRLFRHDCRKYARSLASHLSGIEAEHVLRRPIVTC